MDKIIAEMLDEQLRVLGIYLKEYDKQISSEILGDDCHYELSEVVAAARGKIEEYFEYINK